MAKLYFSYEPRKHLAGSGSLEIDDTEVSPTAKKLLAGTGKHQSDLFGYVWDWFDLTPGDFCSLDALNETSMARLDEYPPDHTDEGGTESAKQAMVYLLSTALLWENLALKALCDESYTEFVSHHSLSVDVLARFEVLISLIDGDGEPPVVTLNAHMKACSEKAASAHRETKKKAIEMYRSGGYKSKNQAAESIAPKIHRTVAVVRGWLQGI